MPIDFPIVPNDLGVPALQSFPGIATIAGSINGTVLTVTDGIGSIAQGLSLSGAGITPGTILTSGLTQIGNNFGLAAVNIPQVVGNVAMTLSGSLSDFFDSATQVLSGDSVDALVGAGLGPRWGIFLDGELALDPDSFLGLDFKRDWHLSDYPIEQGSFETYNKVQVPYENRVMFTKGGSEAERNSFLKQLDSLADSLDLFEIVTPDYIFIDANITHYDYRRTAENGVSLITFTVWFQEVRLEATSEFVSTTSPDAATQVNGGTVQPQTATDLQRDSIANHVESEAW